jgi:hypothetical protein
MEPNDSIDRIGKSLFPRDATSIAADYLAFLAERVPGDLADQLYRDGGTEFTLPSKPMDVAELVRPLLSQAFPCENLCEIANILGFIVTIHRIGIDKNADAEDPYKVLYAASLYLYCFLGNDGVPEHSGYAVSIRMMTVAALRLDLQGRLQVCRFLASLVPMFPPIDSTDEPAPLSCLLVAISVVLGSIVCEASVFAEQAMQAECVEQNWRPGGTSEPEFEDVSALMQMLFKMHGPSGEVRQAADRLLMWKGDQERQ